MKTDSLSFEALSSEHFTLLHKWIQEPYVWQWWGENKLWTYRDVSEKYDSYTFRYKIEQGVRKSVYSYIIQLKGQPIGYTEMN